MICALTPAIDGEVAVDAAGQLLPDLLLGGARRGDLRGQLDDVGLRLLEVEPVAGAGGGELGVLRHAAPRQFERRLQGGDLVGRLLQLFVQLPLAGLRIRQAGLHFADLGPLGEHLRLIRDQLRLERVRPRSHTASDRCGTARRPS